MGNEINYNKIARNRLVFIFSIDLNYYCFLKRDLTIVNLEESRGYDDANEYQKQIDPISFLKPTLNDDYISKIRNRLQEDSHARKEREKRRRKVLVDQLKANEAQEVTLILNFYK